MGSIAEQVRQEQLDQVERIAAHLASLPVRQPQPFSFADAQLAELAAMRPLERRYALGDLYYAHCWHERAAEHYPPGSLSHGEEVALQRWWERDVEARLDEAEAIYAAAIEGRRAA